MKVKHGQRLKFVKLAVILSKHKAEKVMRVLEDKNDDGIIFTLPSEIGYWEKYLDWQK